MEMLDVSKSFLEEFGALSPQEQNERIQSCTIDEVLLLSDNGYVINVDNGKLAVERGE